MNITVQFFAAARAAAGRDGATVTLGPSATLADLEAALATNEELARVLPRCSYLCDEIAVRDRSLPLSDGAAVDVLPPFAGG